MTNKDIDAWGLNDFWGKEGKGKWKGRGRKG